MIDIKMLGTFSITINGTPLVFPYEKPMALCAYLIAEGRPVHRDQAAWLLWPESDEFHARQNLRQALSAVRRAFGGTFASLFSTSKHMLEFTGRDCCYIDSEQLKDAVRTTSALYPHAYSGDAPLPMDFTRWQFCQGIQPRGSNDFAQWLELRRQEYQSYTLSLARNLLAHHRGSGRDALALNVYEQMLAMDRQNEGLVREYMEFLIECGRRPQAINLYREHKGRLQEEQGIRPDQRLVALYDHLINDAEIAC